MNDKTKALLDKLQATGVPLFKISKETGIPATRMYKWFGGKDGKKEAKGSPKYEDIGTLSKWLLCWEKGIPFSNVVNEPKEWYGSDEIAAKVIGHDALFSVLVTEVAALISLRSGEPVQSIVKKIYKAAEVQSGSIDG